MSAGTLFLQTDTSPKGVHRGTFLKLHGIGRGSKTYATLQCGFLTASNGDIGHIHPGLQTWLGSLQVSSVIQAKVGSVTVVCR